MPGENNIFRIGEFLNGRKQPEHPMLSKTMLKLAADEDCYESIIKLPDERQAIAFGISYGWELTKTMFHLGTMKYLMGINEIEEMVLPSAVAELFAYNISKYAGVFVAPIELHENEPTSKNDFIKMRGGIWILSRHVKEGIPIYFMKNAFKLPPVLTNPITRAGTKIQQSIDELLRGCALAAFDKNSHAIRSDFVDFPVEYETDPVVLGAARWSSLERIASYAFRYLFYFSYPHSSNVLVDVDGNLTLIDHEKCVHRADTSDIKELYENVYKSKRVMDVCRQFSNLSESAIQDSLRRIDLKYWKHERAVFIEPDAAAEYFIKRLRAWKHYFKLCEKETHRYEVKSIPNQNVYMQQAALKT